MQSPSMSQSTVIYGHQFATSCSTGSWNSNSSVTGQPPPWTPASTTIPAKQSAIMGMESGGCHPYALHAVPDWNVYSQYSGLSHRLPSFPVTSPGPYHAPVQANPGNNKPIVSSMIVHRNPSGGPNMGSHAAPTHAPHSGAHGNSGSCYVAGLPGTSTYMAASGAQVFHHHAPQYSDWF